MIGGCLIFASTVVSLPCRRFDAINVVQWSDLVGKLGSTMIFITFLFYAAELFPTSVRPHGIGITQVVTKIGALTVPFVIQAGRHIWYLSYVIVLIFVILTIFCVIFLPETAGQGLCHNTRDVEKVATDRRRNLQFTFWFKSNILTARREFADRRDDHIHSQNLISTSE